MYPYITILSKNISVYGIFMFLAILTVFLFSFKRIKKHNVCIDDMLIIAAFSLLFGLTFANLLYVLVSYPISEIAEYVISGKFELLGGLVYYGGLIGGIFGAILGTKVAKTQTSIIERNVVPLLPVGHAIGRVGCLMAGCCNGIKYDGVFAVHYPNSVTGLSPHQGYFPIQIVEALFNILIAIFLIVYSKKERPKYNILFLYLLLYSVVRFSLEFFRGDLARGIYLNISLSQWVSIILFLVSTIYFSYNYLKNKSSRSQ